MRRPWDPLQRANEPRELLGGVNRVGEVVEGRVLPLDPIADGPRALVALARFTERDRDRNGERQARREFRQPSMLLVDLLELARPELYGHANRHLVTKPIDGV